MTVQIDEKYLIDSKTAKKELDSLIISFLNGYMIEEEDRESVTRILSIGFQEGIMAVARKFHSTNSLDFDNFENELAKHFEGFSKSFLKFHSIPEEGNETYKKVLFFGFQKGADFSYSEFQEKILDESECEFCKVSLNEEEN